MRWMNGIGSALMMASALTACNPAQDPAQSAPAPTAEAAQPAPAAEAPAVQEAGDGELVTPQYAAFDRYLEDLRIAVMEKDKEGVARMTRFPFIDYQGAYCEEVDKGRCPSPASAITALTREEFLAKYDRIMTPEVIDAIVNRRVKRGDDPGESPGPATADEYILDLPEPAQQRVFSPGRDGWKMSRVPFYS